jgi:hypothetical protein
MANFKYLVMLLLFLPIVAFSQTGPPAPSAGTWAIIDTNYQVGTTTAGVTHAKLTLQNTTVTNTVGIQFRVFYDKIAFTNATVALIGSTSNLDMQYVTNTAGGYITVTLIYTGSSNTYTLANGERFDVTFTHAPQAIFNNLTSIDDLTWSGVQPFDAYATSQAGMDVTLNLHNYGGNFIFQNFDYHGTFKNVTGTPAKDLTLALEKRPATGGTWTQVNTYMTNANGHFNISEPIDTTYWDVRLAVKGDTMAVGNIISTTDAQLINQWVLGNAVPSGFDYYAADINESDNITVSDAAGVFGRIAGRISAWPGTTEDVKFFTSAEYATINGSATNYTSTITGATNFTFDIVPGQPDSVTYYVVVPGDANGTGYHMARQTPIDILLNPVPGVDSQIYHVIDTKVEYDFPTSEIEVNVPSLSVQEGSIVNVPVKVLTGGIQLSALQFGLKYNDTLLQFRGAYATANATEWLSYINANDGEISWGGYDNTNNLNPINNGDDIVTLQFAALKPQLEWEASPLWTSDKFAGQRYTSKDLAIRPTGGILQVVKISNNVIMIDDNSMEIYPNPVKDEITIIFNVSKPTEASLTINDVVGRKLMTLVSGKIPEGQFEYQTNLGKLAPGLYVATLSSVNGEFIAQKIIKQ